MEPAKNAFTLPYSMQKPSVCPGGDSQVILLGVMEGWLIAAFATWLTKKNSKERERFYKPNRASWRRLSSKMFCIFISSTQSIMVNTDRYTFTVFVSSRIIYPHKIGIKCWPNSLRWTSNQTDLWKACKTQNLNKKNDLLLINKSMFRKSLVSSRSFFNLHSKRFT